MSLEFDPQCATAQPEDSLQLYVPTLSNGQLKTSNRSAQSEEPDSLPLPYWPVLHKFSGRYYDF